MYDILGVSSKINWKLLADTSVLRSSQRCQLYGSYSILSYGFAPYQYCNFWLILAEFSMFGGQSQNTIIFFVKTQISTPLSKVGNSMVLAQSCSFRNFLLICVQKWLRKILSRKVVWFPIRKEKSHEIVEERNFHLKICPLWKKQLPCKFFNIFCQKNFFLGCWE